MGIFSIMAQSRMIYDPKDMCLKIFLLPNRCESNNSFREARTHILILPLRRKINKGILKGFKHSTPYHSAGNLAHLLYQLGIPSLGCVA